MEQAHLKYLLGQYLSGKATDSERNELLDWYRSFNHEEVLWPAEGPEEEAAVFKRLQENIVDKTRPSARKMRRRLIWLTSAAALILAISAIALYLYRTKPEAGNIAATEILPGYNQATLTLADGTKVALDSAQSGIIINNEDISYNDGSKLSAVMLSEAEASHKPDETHSTHSASGGSAQGDALLQLSTPKGGQYQIILEDGTKVWLNAASTLKYPSRFSGETRTVELEGEAYFSVNNSTLSPYGGEMGRNNPFIVKTRNQQATVLGTEFNISAFADEAETKITLVKGKVQVRSGSKKHHTQVLRPKQQAIVKDDSLTVSMVDVEAVTAWKNGYFQFKSQDIHSVMRSIARWYNIEVVYRTPEPTDAFGGNISRFENVSEVLHLLELTGKAHFKIEGRTVIVSR